MSGDFSEVPIGDDGYLQLTPRQERLYFLSFCVEQFRQRHHATGAQAIDQLFPTGALDFLNNNYEVLKHLNMENILDDLDEYLKNHPLT